MGNTLKAKWLALTQGLWFVPGIVVVLFAALAIVLVEVDRSVNWSGVDVVFRGDDSAARTVLSTVAGSLITVAGLTFSITIVVLQLASSQFSPRVLRNVFGDRLTQITVGTFVGIFVYALLVLRAVGDFGESAGFIPRLSVTVATGLAILAVVLLVAFIHHIGQMIQVSQIAADVGRRVLTAIDTLYPEEYGGAVDEDGAAVVRSWLAESEPGLVHPSRPGYVQLVGLDDIGGDGGTRPTRVHVCVRPGQFVSLEQPLAAVWPAETAERCEGVVRRGVTIADERDFAQDADFGFRQLTDIALKALSPGINDPTTAITCIGYLRAALAQLAARDFPSAVRRLRDGELTIVSERQGFADYLTVFAEIGHYGSADTRVIVAVLEALAAVAGEAHRAGSPDRARDALELARTVTESALEAATTERGRSLVRAARDEVERAAAGATATSGR